MRTTQPPQTRMITETLEAEAAPWARHGSRASRACRAKAHVPIK